MPARRSLLALPALLLPAAAARPQPVTQDARLLVPFAPGGTVDFLGRLLAEALTPAMGGHQVVVENRSGAGTLVAMLATANAPPNGLTVSLAGTTTLATAPVLPGMTLPLDLDRQLVPVTNLIRVPMVLVARSDAPYRSMAELLAWGRANPGRLNIGNSGLGGQTHLLAARLAHETGIALEHVQYRGGTPALLDVLAGNCQLYFSLLPESLPFIRDGRLRPLGFASEARNATLPEVPLIRDTVTGFTGDVGYGLVMGASNPPEWQAFWNRAVNAAMAQPEVRRKLEERQLLLVNGSAAAYRAEIENDRKVWGAVIQAAGIRAG